MTLERRVSISYLIAFAIVLAIFTAAVHAVFALDVAREDAERLDELLEAGKTAVTLHGGRPTINTEAVHLADRRSEGIVWYAVSGRALRVLGAPPGSVGDFATQSAALRALKPANGDAPAGERAIVSRASSQRLLRRLDLGLFVGLLASLAAAVIGGQYLARRSLVRVVSTIRTLRDFTADAAHELRGPLAALESNAGASLRDAGDLPAIHRRRLETIAGTAAGMARTVDDLLLLARAEMPLERELFAVDLAAHVTSAVEARRVLAEQRRITLSAEPYRARIYGNPDDIDRILGNLIDNALHYTPPGGSIAVVSAPERRGVSVRVRDTGVGIAAADLPQIFERFWRADNVRTHTSGTGLGLAIVRALVRRHGGDVAVRSSARSGSEFTVWFPLRPHFGLDDFSTIS